MESCLFNKQRPIQTTSHVLWIVQFTRNIPKNDEQYLSRTTPQRSIGELHGQLCDTGQNNGRTQEKNYSVLEDCRKTQSVFQTVKI